MRKYVPKNNTKTDNIFRSRFSKVNFHYFDIIFREETLNEYIFRVNEVLNTLIKIIKNQDNVLILLREINPILDFLHVIESNLKTILK